MASRLTTVEHQAEDLSLLVLLPVDSSPLLTVRVSGFIANSVTDRGKPREKALSWKREVAAQVKARRGSTPWPEARLYAISLGFSFRPGSHGGGAFDVENYLKPVLDGVAAGLFCSNEVATSSIVSFSFNDSGFHHLLVQRLRDASSAHLEGVALAVAAGAA